MAKTFQAIAVLVVLLLSFVSASADVTTTLYGYIKLDASYDSAETNDGNYVYFVLPYAEGDEQHAFNMTAKQTRLGITMKGPEADMMTVSGRVEVDFYGGGAENKPNPMLRHAYFTMGHGDWQLLAGQTSDVISPIVPTTLNYIVLWKSGDIGYRRPQIRFTKSMDMGDSKLGLALSANRSMGEIPGAGEQTGIPSFQGRLSYGMNMMGKPMELGVSGLVGREDMAVADSLGEVTDFELDQTVVAVDLTLPLGNMITVKGQYFTGQDLAQYLGGVGQGVAIVESGGVSSFKEIEATGWWAQVTLAPMPELQFNFGTGTDDPELPDGTVGVLPAFRDYEFDKNTTYYGNVIWTVAPGTKIGVEYSNFETEYVNGESYKDNRVQLSCIYNF